MVTWQLTKGTSFKKVRSRLIQVKARSQNQGNAINAFYVDNCCTWKKKLQEVFGQNLNVKLYLFHAEQCVVKKSTEKRQAWTNNEIDKTNNDQ